MGHYYYIVAQKGGVRVEGIIIDTVRYIYPLLYVHPPPTAPISTQGPPPPASTPLALCALMLPSSTESSRYRDGIPLFDISSNSGEVHMVVDFPYSLKAVVISSNKE